MVDSDDIEAVEREWLDLYSYLKNKPEAKQLIMIWCSHSIFGT